MLVGTNKWADGVPMMLTRVGLEGDGVSSHFFDLLWKKDMLKGIPSGAAGIRIPDTVLFRFNSPNAWYFTSVDGTIKRKNTSKLNPDKIFEEFQKKSSPSGIVACYIQDAAVRCRQLDGEREDDGSTQIEYFDLESLREFLFERRDRPDGLLQKFIHPAGENNHLLRALWSPHVTMLERCTNRRNINDSRFDLYQRAATFEAPNHEVEAQPVRGSALTTCVKAIAEQVAEHIYLVSSGALSISRMALNFKTDAKDRVWLLFASSLRLEDELLRTDKLSEQECSEIARHGFINTPLELDVLKLPEHVRNGKASGKAAPTSVKEKQFCECPACSEQVETCRLVVVPYRLILDGEEAATGSSDIPAVFRTLFPNTSKEDLKALVHTPNFRLREVGVCEECYMRYSTPLLGKRHYEGMAQKGREANPTARRSPPRVVQHKPLQPDRLRERRLQTEDRVAAEKEASLLENDAQAIRLHKLKRVNSCPKLTIPCVPGPRLYPAPQPPRGVAPPSPEGFARYGAGLGHSIFSANRAARSASYGDLTKRQPPRSMGPLPKGQPYLAALDEFLSAREDRAVEILGPKTAELRSKVLSKSHREAFARAKKAEAQSAAQFGEPAVEVEDPTHHVWNVGPNYDLDDVEVDEESQVDEAVEVAARVAPSVIDRCLPYWPLANKGSRNGSGTATPTTRTPSLSVDNFSALPSGVSSRTGSRPISGVSSHREAEAIFMNAGVPPGRLPRKLSLRNVALNQALLGN